MARICEYCGKGPQSGNKVSHANNKTKRRWIPNLKRVKVKIGKSIKTMRLCTRCLRSGKLQKAA